MLPGAGNGAARRPAKPSLRSELGLGMRGHAGRVELARCQQAPGPDFLAHQAHQQGGPPPPRW